MHSNLDAMIIIDDAVISARLGIYYPRHFRRNWFLYSEIIRHLNNKTETSFK